MEPSSSATTSLQPLETINLSPTEKNTLKDLLKKL